MSLIRFPFPCTGCDLVYCVDVRVEDELRHDCKDLRNRGLNGTETNI